MIKLYNTLTRKKEQFIPLRNKRVGIYACGLTVYNFAHIGNLRTYIFEDLLRRTFTYYGYKADHVMNITDVGHLTSDADSGEDKMQKALTREGLEPSVDSLLKLAEKYTQAFQQDLVDLNILEPTKWCKATEHIADMVTFIKLIARNGFTYETEDAVYFDTEKFADYPKLAQLSPEGQQAGKRVAMGSKKNLTDFALWLKAVGKNKKHVMVWDSPWGKGFPGWHIECSTLSTKYLGKKFDIHCGGIDHIPIHHTNERAQSFAAFNLEPVKYWLHGAFLVIDQARMGKSQGNFITLKDIKAKGYSPLDLRYLYLTAHYRKTLNFSWPSLNFAQESYSKLREFMIRLSEYKKIGSNQKLEKQSLELKNKFEQAINDDLNLPRALSYLLDYSKALNKAMDEEGQLPVATIVEQIYQFDQVLGLDLKNVRQEQIPDDINQLIKKREQARHEGKYKEADQIRDQLKKMKVELKDTGKGTKVKIN
ncbi:cysteine--tRNA ligase [Patescibacteria group bacterium]|nr:cysteine--tRNA ligase [Patescibacteria group bacterium]